MTFNWSNWLLNTSEIEPNKSAILGDNLVVFYTIHCVAICLIITSLVACTLVITSILCCSEKNRWNFADRFPLYLAIADALWGISHLTDHLVLVTTCKYPESFYATGLSINLLLFLGYQQMMHAGLAIYTYLKIVRRLSLNLGRGEWKLHAISFKLMILTIFIFYPFDSFGYTGYWLLQNVRTTGGLILGFYIASAATFHALCTTLSYRSIKRVVDAQKEAMIIHKRSTSYDKGDQNQRSYQTNGYHSTASECLTTFVKIALVLYCPLAVASWALSFQTLFGFIEPFTAFVIIIVANSSGWVNGLGYLYNNRVKARRQARHEFIITPNPTISVTSTSTK